VTTNVEFKPWAKIARLNREWIITEKIDGTNGVVHVADDGTVTAGSRNRWIGPGDDGFGFAAWVRDHAAELRDLGPGYHYGEWWGSGIQRRYGLTEKRFSLFNVSRWGESRPACCHVVPVLDRTATATGLAISVVALIEALRVDGSLAAPGFMKPEGIVAFHTASGALFKVTLEKDEAPKGAA
jgi:hypothetical protein